jgi:hypothetical protein
MIPFGMAADSWTVSNEDTQPELILESFTYAERTHLLPDLGAAVDLAGGWVLERHSLAADAVEVYLEVQMAALPEVYGALLASGLELTRDSHRALAERCNCDLYLRPRHGISSILSLRVDIRFLPESPQPMDLYRRMLLNAAAA